MTPPALSPSSSPVSPHYLPQQPPAAPQPINPMPHLASTIINLSLEEDEDFTQFIFEQPPVAPQLQPTPVPDLVVPDFSLEGGWNLESPESRSGSAAPAA